MTGKLPQMGRAVAHALRSHGRVATESPELGKGVVPTQASCLHYRGARGVGPFFGFLIDKVRRCASSAGFSLNRLIWLSRALSL